MSDTPTRDAKHVPFLNEAYAKEKQLEMSLQSHADMTTRDDYAKRLKDHLKEPKSHATQLARAASSSSAGAPRRSRYRDPKGLRPDGGERLRDAGKAKAAAQAPLQAIRGAGEQEKMLHNARIEYEDEAHEIAT